MITFEEIQKANEGLSSIDLKDKAYVMVPQRVKAFRKLYPEGFILTDILSFENGVVLMKTEVGYYDGDRKVVLGTGMAYEKESNGFINKTSLIENAETSAVGRALGFLALGIDGGGICSAEELINAVNNQNRNASASTQVSSINKGDTAVELSDIRDRLGAAIKEKTKNMSKAEKIQFLNTVVTPALNGERNWRLCENPELLRNLLAFLEKNAA